MLDYCAACTRPSVTQTVYTRTWRGRTRVDRDAGGDAGRREGRGGVPKTVRFVEQSRE